MNFLRKFLHSFLEGFNYAWHQTSPRVHPDPRFRPRFGVIIYITDPPHQPYRIIEHQPTCDGVRTRLTEKSFASREEAEAMAVELSNLFAGDLE